MPYVSIEVGVWQRAGFGEGDHLAAVVVGEHVVPLAAHAAGGIGVDVEADHVDDVVARIPIEVIPLRRPTR